MEKAIVIGAGFGGLALAIRLQSAGLDTILIEARDRPGGRAYVWETDGFTFDAGPTVITDPDCLAELWSLSGRAMTDDIELLPVSPFYRLQWPDGTRFDYGNDGPALRDAIAAINPADVQGYERFLAYSAAVHAEGYVKLGAVPFLDFRSMIRAAPALARQRAWSSVYSTVSRYIANEKLRQAFSFHTLLVGGNPMRTSGIYALIHKLEQDGGVWFARGGTNRLVAAMLAHFERLGGTSIIGDKVEKIICEGERVSGVMLASGRTITAGAVACNSDIMHSYADLLAHPRGAKIAKRLARKKWSPSLFVLHFGVRGRFPDVPHHMILFGERYRELLADIYDRGTISDDFALYLHHPSATDASMAPPDHSTFYALVPVPHLGNAFVDWDIEGPKLAQRIVERLERRLLPGLAANIVASRSYAPTDFARDLAAHHGSAFSLLPSLTQSAWFRTHNRDDQIDNLYFVGAGTHPGAGIPGVIASAKATAGLMLERASAAA